MHKEIKLSYTCFSLFRGRTKSTPVKKTTKSSSNGKGRKKNMVKIKEEPETFVWTLETEDDIFFFSSKENALDEINIFKEKNPGKPYRSGKYNDNGEAREAYDNFIASVANLTQAETRKLFERTINLCDGGDEGIKMKSTQKDVVSDDSSKEDVDDNKTKITQANAHKGLKLKEVDLDLTDNPEKLFYGFFTKDEDPVYFHSRIEMQLAFENFRVIHPDAPYHMDNYASKFKAWKASMEFWDKHRIHPSETTHVNDAGRKKEPSPITPEKATKVEVKDGNTKRSSMENPYVVKHDSVAEKRAKIVDGENPPVTFDGISFRLHDMVTILCRNNAIMEVTAFFPGGSKVENDNMRVDKIMICLDCMVNRQISGPSGPVPFWLFKPFLFEAFPFASKEQSPLFHEAYTMMMEVSKREKAFGESKPLEHMNKNRPWKHNMLVTWIKLKEDMTVEEQMKLFLEDFKKTILIKQCQVNFHLAAQMKFPKSMTDLMMPLDLIEKRSLNNSLSGQTCIAL